VPDEGEDAWYPEHVMISRYMTIFENNMDMEQKEMFGATVDFSALRPDQLIDEKEDAYGDITKKIEYAVDSEQTPMVIFSFQPIDAFFDTDGPDESGAVFPHINVHADGHIASYYMNFVEGFGHVPETAYSMKMGGLQEYDPISHNIILPKWIELKTKGILSRGGVES
jgi:hypothetical protein